jgi:hypothetical protein
MRLQGRESLLMRLRVMAKTQERISRVSEQTGKPASAYQWCRLLSAPVTIPKAAPVDADSRQKLLVETYPVVIDVEPVWPSKTDVQLNRFVIEWEMKERLIKRGFTFQSLLMGGPPGVGKTLAAKWLACKLDMPLLTLDLASVMSSYLGKRGIT